MLNGLAVKGEENMLLQTRVDRLGECGYHQPTDAPLKLVVPSILFDSSCQIIVEEEAYDQTSLPLGAALPSVRTGMEIS